MHKYQPRNNILYGDNAQGKTNILEALYLAGTTKSHRGSKDREIIQFDREEAHIRMMVERNGSTHKIDMHLKKINPRESPSMEFRSAKRRNFLAL